MKGKAVGIGAGVVVALVVLYFVLRTPEERPDWNRTEASGAKAVGVFGMDWF